ncbi:MAG: AAA family ATPase [Bacteroidota bacterium]|nr:AAA family ATPase [Bacteroidota bacterium]
MKIAIIGAHRVGKTTLAEKLQESLPDYDYRPEPYYDLEETGYVFSEIPNVDDYLEQLEYSFEQILKSGNNVIFDRCPIDILAYIQAMNDSENIQTLYHNVQNVITEIDLLVFVPIENPDLISCPESELPELRSDVNDILNEWVWDFGIETIEVRGTLLSRRDQVLNKILKE